MADPSAYFTAQSGTKRRMQELEVFVNEHCDVVIGYDDAHDSGQYVLMSPDQVDLVVEWLQEARDKARQALAEREQSAV